MFLQFFCKSSNLSVIAQKTLLPYQMTTFVEIHFAVHMISYRNKNKIDKNTQ